MRSKYLLYIAFILQTWVLTSCKSSNNELSWVKDSKNGWRFEKAENNILFTVQMLPTQSDTLPQMADFRISFKHEDPKKDIHTELRAKYGKGDIDKFFSYDFEKLISLEVKDQKLIPALYVYEQGTDLSNSINLFVGFDYEPKEDMTLVFEPDITGIALQRVKFNKEDIQNKP